VPPATSFCTCSIIAGTAPWKRVAGCERNAASVLFFLVGLARQRQIFEIGSGQRRGCFPPAFRRQIKIRGTNQVSHAAAFVRFFNAGPDFIQFQVQRFGLVENYPRFRKQAEDAAVGARHRSIELPARKNSRARVAHCLLHDLRRSGNAFPRKPRVDRPEQFFRDRRFRQRQSNASSTGFEDR
jgi:hypothetical protein